MRSFLHYAIFALTMSTGFFQIYAIDHPDTPGLMNNDSLTPYGSSECSLEGWLGERIDSCIRNGVMAVNYHLYSRPFANHTDDQDPKFKGEFWGKWFTSAILGYNYHQEKEYEEIIESSLSEILKTQEQDGRISSYSRKNSFDMWDIWGRKYVLLGLVSRYEQSGDVKVLEAACRVTDELIHISGPGKTRLTETGLRVLGSMSSTTILEPIVLVYKYTGKKKYLNYAEYLVSLWSEPNAYTDKGMRLIEDALNGVPPVRISSPKAYEMMSCFEGLCELYRVTDNPLYLNAVKKFAENLLEREIMITGSGSASELWCEGAFRQTQLLEQPMETCVTVTWLKLCYQLLRLTGDSKWADQMEITLYNSLLGALNKKGDWWAYFSPLTGERMPSPLQIPQCQSSCCVANGPRGLLLTPQWAVMKGEEGPVINLYNPGKWKFMQNGENINLTIKGNYPVSDEIIVAINQPIPSDFTLNMRIPGWSLHNTLTVNEDTLTVFPGEYAAIHRTWQKNDTLRFKPDMRGRIIPSPGGLNHLSVMRGPVVLAMDNRLVDVSAENLWLYARDSKWKHQDELGGLDYVLPEVVNAEKRTRYIDIKPMKKKHKDFRMVFEVPFLFRPTHFFGHEIRYIPLCDYASAGNQYTTDNLFRVWLPQPLYMKEAFPSDTWRILYEGKNRPVFPFENKPRKNQGTRWKNQED